MSVVVTFKGVATKDPPKKKRKRWVDCEVDADARTGVIKLFQVDENGKRSGQLGILQKRQTSIKAGDEIEFDSGWSCEIEDEIRSLPTVPSSNQGSHCESLTIGPHRPSKSSVRLPGGQRFSNPFNPLIALDEEETAPDDEEPDAGVSQSSQLSLFADCVNDCAPTTPTVFKATQLLKRPRTDAEILALLSSSQSISPDKKAEEAQTDENLNNQQSEDVPSISVIDTGNDFAIFDEPVEEDLPNEIEASAVEETCTRTATSSSKHHPYQRPYHPPRQTTASTTTTFRPPAVQAPSFCRPLMNSTSSANAYPAAVVATSTLRPPQLGSASGGGSSSFPRTMTRKVSYPLRFSSPLHYVQSLQPGWTEEIQLILDQTFDKITTSTISQQTNVFKSKATLNCVKFGGKTMPAGKRYYIQAPGLRDKAKGFGVGDVWVITPTNNGSGEATLWESTWYGASAENKIEVKPISKSLPRCITSFIPTSNHNKNEMVVPVIAVHGPCVRTELSALRLIEGFEADVSASPRVVQGLIGNGSVSLEDERLVVSSWDVVDSILESHVTQFGLNEAQIQVVKAVVNKTFREYQQSSSPVNNSSQFVLVNGPFGSGKSQTIACCVMVLDAIAKELLEESPELKKIRIGVAAATNVAVDRVLTCLVQDHGFPLHQVARIGSVKAVNRMLLSRMIHYSKNAVREARMELLRMKERDREAEDDVNLALDSLSRATEIANESRITGFTCCSSENEEMDLVFPPSLFHSSPQHGFNVVFLDEGSQMLEPIALLPICNARANSVCVFGDLKQLPPVSPFPSSSTANNSGCPSGIGMTLFERLSRLYPDDVFTLSTSFRCHPDICRLASELFYGNSIVPGITEAARPPLVKDLSPISVLDVSNGLERKTGSGSYQNDQECLAIKRVVRLLIAEHGMDPSRIAVATLFVAQADLLRQRIVIDSETRPIRVATVDAFQGAESDVLIVSTCRTERSQFAEQTERLNVLLTRAKHHLIVVGSKSMLMASPVWRRVCESATPFDLC